jgi:hypothetical protein
MIQYGFKKAALTGVRALPWVLCNACPGLGEKFLRIGMVHRYALRAKMDVFAPPANCADIAISIRFFLKNSNIGVE